MSRVNIQDELNLLVAAVTLAQSKGAYSLEEAEQVSQCVKSLKNKLNPPTPPPSPPPTPKNLTRQKREQLLSIEEDEDLELA